MRATNEVFTCRPVTRKLLARNAVCSSVTPARCDGGAKRYVWHGKQRVTPAGSYLGTSYPARSMRMASFERSTSRGFWSLFSRKRRSPPHMWKGTRTGSGVTRLIASACAESGWHATVRQRTDASYLVLLSIA
jgi:hypothetical protein